METLIAVVAVLIIENYTYFTLHLGLKKIVDLIKKR